MEMAVYEGQRCEKATGKISFLDSPTMSYQRRTFSACGDPPESSGDVHVFVYGDADAQNNDG